ncbi:hypothetical protein SGM_6086 [Streptomyces griseoaurantiacus M045]|uniref:Uncharacterized protein n=1 Tax=Streptomyces griseoaurantiacus M045 TaxID=996637 RepID=F3NSH2_9ACTN|nr:hypothetical protein SGM_6086 [Streptomyces griseoaurantiacus M045]
MRQPWETAITGRHAAHHTTRTPSPHLHAPGGGSGGGFPAPRAGQIGSTPGRRSRMLAR